MAAADWTSNGAIPHPATSAARTEPRWVRAIEVRPGTVKGRKITHHANVDLDQVEADARGQQVTVGRFMEWAVGKEGELMRPNSGKLLLPGSRIAWDIHYSQTDEDVTDVAEMGIYFYPKGQTPKYRQSLLRMGGTGVVAQLAPGERGRVVGTITRFGSICVNGLKIAFEADTPTVRDGRAIPAADLQVGQMVRVEVARSGAGLRAQSIALLSSLVGTVTARDEEARAFRVMGQPVRLSRSTWIGISGTAIPAVAPAASSRAA